MLLYLLCELLCYCDLVPHAIKLSEVQHATSINKTVMNVTKITKVHFVWKTGAMGKVCSFFVVLL